MFIEQRRKFEDNENEKRIEGFKIQRLNTFYLLKIAGFEGTNATELYALKDDPDSEIKYLDPNSPEALEMFEKNK